MLILLADCRLPVNSSLVSPDFQDIGRQISRLWHLIEQHTHGVTRLLRYL